MSLSRLSYLSLAFLTLTLPHVAAADDDAGDAELLALAAADAEQADEVITVVGEAPDLAEPTVYELDRDQVRALPGTGNDILRAAQSLPGVARIPFGLGGLSLRGASPRDSNVYLDGIDVPVAFHFGAVASFFPSTLLDSMTITPGGGDAAWGRSIGGVVELRSRAPRAERWRIGGEVGLIDVAATAEGPTPGGGAIALGVRRSHVDAVLGELDVGDDHLMPRYYDAQLRWDLPVAGGTLTALGFVSNDRTVAVDATLAQRFARGALRWRRQVGATQLTVTPWAGTDAFDFTGKVMDGPRGVAMRRTFPLGLRAELVHDTNWGHIAGGIDLTATRTESLRQDRDFKKPLEQAPIWMVDAGAWAEARWRIADGALTVKPGVRADHFQASDQWVADPRLAISHELGPVTVREMVGVHHQPASISDWALLNDLPSRAPRSVHGSVGAELSLGGGTAASLSAYHVAMDHLPVTPVYGALDKRLPSVPGGGLGAVGRELLEEQLSMYNAQKYVGQGRSSGLELSIRRSSARWMGWISYTLSRAERTFDPDFFEGWGPYVLDQTHNLNAVGSVRLGDWQLGARVRYASGLPYTPPVMVDTDGPPDRQPVPAYTRLPGFFSLDLRVDRSWRPKWGTVSVFLDVTNATNADNIEDITKDDDGQTHRQRGMPIFPSFGLSLTPG